MVPPTKTISMATHQQWLPVRRNLALWGVVGAVGMAVCASGPAWSADTTPPASVHQADPLTAARQALARQRWDDALQELRKVRAEGDADWNNLMGYAMRKRSPPDLVSAQRHYDAALRLDPDHRGALEYAGELALMKGDLATAEVHLSRLARLCAAGCEERADLERAVARFKAAAPRARS
jgi:Flp pilus assembly protein TadD